MRGVRIEYDRATVSTLSSESSSDESKKPSIRTTYLHTDKDAAAAGITPTDSDPWDSSGPTVIAMDGAHETAASENRNDTPPTPSGPANVDGAEWKDLFAFLQPWHCLALASAIVSTAVQVGTEILTVVLLGKIFEEVARFAADGRQPSKAFGNVMYWVHILAAVAAAHLVASVCLFKSWIKFGEQQAMGARRRLFKCMLLRDMAWFDSRRDGMPSILTANERSIRELQIANSQVMGFLAHDLMLSLAGVVVAFCYGAVMTLVIIASIPLALLPMRALGHNLEKEVLAQKAAQVGANKIAAAGLTGIDLVKVYNAQEHELHNYKQSVRASGKHARMQTRWDALQRAFLQLYMIVIFVIGFFFGVYQVSRGAMQAGDVLVTFYAALTTFQGIEGLAPHILAFVKGKAAGKALKEQASREEHRMDGDKPASFSGKFELKNVRFAYPSNPSVQVLKSVSMEIKPGKTTFIIGRSGSGKSTIANLMMRFYDPSAGEFMLDNTPLRNLSAEWLRRSATLVQQQSTLFSDTLRANIALGHTLPESVRPEDLKSACEMALLQSTILSLPKGLDTMVGTGGHSLSGGQKQRVALARARLRSTPVLILDEITSGLDPKSRAMIMEAVRVWRAGKTTIIITHDVTQVEDNDQVFVMEDGAVKEEGICKYLLCREDGFFCRMRLLSYDSLCTVSGQVEDARESDESSSDEDDDMSRVPIFYMPGIEGNTSTGARLSRMSLVPPSSSAGARRLFERRPITAGLVSKDETPPKGPLHDQPVVRDTTKVSSPRNTSLDIVQERGLAARAIRLESRGRIEPPRPAHPRSSLMAPDAAAEAPAPSRAAADVQQDPCRKRTPRSILRVLKTVWPALDRKHRVGAALSLASCIVAASCSPLFAYAFANLLHAFWAPGDMIGIGTQWALIMTGVGILDFAALFTAFSLAGAVAQQWVDSLKVDGFFSTLCQPRAWHDKSKNSPGRVCDILDRGAEETRSIVAQFLPIAIMVVFMVLTGLVWALTILWKLALVVTGMLLLAAWTVYYSSRTSEIWETRCNGAAESTGALFAEVASNIRIVRAFSLERHFAEKFSCSTKDVYGLGKRRGWLAGIWYGVQCSIADWIIVIIFSYGMSLATSRGEASVSSIVQVVNLLLFTTGNATAMLGSIPQIAAAQAKAAQILGFASLPRQSTFEQQGGKRVLTPFPITFSALRFAYPSRPSTTVLHNISLTIPGEGCTAIVGPSGCGKSTIISLILRLYEPQYSAASADDTALPRARQSEVATSQISVGSGRRRGSLPLQQQSTPPLRFAGVDARELSTRALRTMMAYVPQQPFLYPTTIAANIVYGLPEGDVLRSQEKIEDAARAAGIHDFVISLPQGYNTIVGDGGFSVSGGQAQRLCIARALLRKPRLLVLDEPTSSLDPESRNSVLETIRNLVGGAGARPRSASAMAEFLATGERPRRSSGSAFYFDKETKRRHQKNTSHGAELTNIYDNPHGMAVVVVTHSQETMKIADRIIVVDGGVVAEEGTYDALLASRGKLAELLGGFTHPLRRPCRLPVKFPRAHMEGYGPDSQQSTSADVPEVRTNPHTNPLMAEARLRNQLFRDGVNWGQRCSS